MTPPPKKLLAQVRDAIRVRHYSYRTEEAYVQSIRRFILFHNKRHLKDMGAAEVEAFLPHLAVYERVAASTQNQAFSALLFLYREVLRLELDESINASRSWRIHPGRLSSKWDENNAKAESLLDNLLSVRQL